MYRRVAKKFKNLTFKVTFLCLKLCESFYFFSFIFLGAHFLLLTFLTTSNLKTLLFSIMMPNFWQHTSTSVHKMQYLPFGILIFSQNISNFVSLPWKLDNPYYHNDNRSDRSFGKLQRKLKLRTKVIIVWWVANSQPLYCDLHNAYLSAMKDEI